MEELLAGPAPGKTIGVRFAAIGHALRLAPAVLPRPMRVVQPAHGANGLARLVRDALVLPVPNHDAGMVPSLPHPLRVLRDDLRRHEFFGRVAAAGPDGKFVLNQEAFLVGDVVPEFGRETDAIAERVPVHLAEFLVQATNPVGPPRQVAAQGVLEEAVDADVAAAHEVDFVVEHHAVRLRVAVKTPHAEAGGRAVAAGCHNEPVEERLVGRPELAEWYLEKRNDRLIFTGPLPVATPRPSKPPTKLPLSASVTFQKARLVRACRPCRSRPRCRVTWWPGRGSPECC